MPQPDVTAGSAIAERLPPPSISPAIMIPGQIEHRVDMRFRMRQRVLAFDDVYWIENGEGQRVFQVDCKALRTRATLMFKDAQGSEIYSMNEKLVRVRDSMRIYRGSAVAARIHNALFTQLYNRFRVEITGGDDLTTRGTILYHEYMIERHGNIVARVSKRWFPERDAYGVDVRPGEDALLFLAITTIIDLMSHDGH